MAFASAWQCHPLCATGPPEGMLSVSQSVVAETYAPPEGMLSVSQSVSQFSCFAALRILKFMKISKVQRQGSSRRESRKCRTGCRDGLNMHPWGTCSKIFFENLSAGFHPRDRRFPETLRLAVFLRSSAPCVSVGELPGLEDVFGLRGIFGFLSSNCPKLLLESSSVIPQDSLKILVLRHFSSMRTLAREGS